MGKDSGLVQKPSLPGAPKEPRKNPCATWATVPLDEAIGLWRMPTLIVNAASAPQTGRVLKSTGGILNQTVGFESKPLSSGIT